MRLDLLYVAGFYIWLAGFQKNYDAIIQLGFTSTTIGPVTTTRHAKLLSFSLLHKN